MAVGFTRFEGWFWPMENTFGTCRMAQTAYFSRRAQQDRFWEKVPLCRFSNYGNCFGFCKLELLVG
jgi:hypothetical protein